MITAYEIQILTFNVFYFSKIGNSILLCTAFWLQFLILRAEQNHNGALENICHFLLSLSVLSLAQSVIFVKGEKIENAKIQVLKNICTSLLNFLYFLVVVFTKGTARFCRILFNSALKEHLLTSLKH